MVSIGFDFCFYTYSPPDTTEFQSHQEVTDGLVYVC